MHAALARFRRAQGTPSCISASTAARLPVRVVVSDSETKSSVRIMRVPRIPGLAGGPKIILLPPPPGRTVKAHATTTALWMRSYGSVLVRVPAFG